MKIKYEMDGKYICKTKCPNGTSEYVANYGCQMRCEHFIDIDEFEQEVTCLYDETKKE